VSDGSGRLNGGKTLDGCGWLGVVVARKADLNWKL